MSHAGRVKAGWVPPRGAQDGAAGQAEVTSNSHILGVSELQK